MAMAASRSTQTGTFTASFHAYRPGWSVAQSPSPNHRFFTTL